ncbi:MAG: ABC transporter permease [Aquiluna sp.]|jgi:rhamnose transport system permease protein|tara:strand:- start:1618 stop:2592 length:975 start_codon:yes stop_codon:yes gene_type:complete
MNLPGQLMRARELPVFAALVIVMGLTSVAVPHFFSAKVAVDLFLGVSVIALLAIAQTFVIVMRHIDLSVGSTVGFAAFLIGDSYSKGFGLEVSMLLAIGLGVTVGAVNGFLVAYLKLPSLVVTLASLYIVRGIFNEFASGETIIESEVPPVVNWLGLNRLFGVPYLFIIGLVVLLIAGLVMKRVKAARDLYAIGSNPAAAELAGIPVARRVLFAFMSTGALTGLAGALLLGRFNSANPNSGLGLELLVVAACVVGGVTIAGGAGSVFGAFFGALLLQGITLSIGALGIPQFWQQAVNGSLIIGAIALDRYLSTRVKTTTIMGSK